MDPTDAFEGHDSEFSNYSSCLNQETTATHRSWPIDAATVTLPELSEDRRNELAVRRARRQLQRSERNDAYQLNETRPPTAVLKVIFENSHSEQSAALSARGSERSNSNSSSQQKRSYLYTLLNPHSRQIQAKVYKTFITAIILGDVLFFLLSCDETAKESISPYTFIAMDGLASTIFLIEYMARLVVAPESRAYAEMPSWKARVLWVLTLPAIVDLIACVPFFLECILADYSFPELSTLRVFRLFRILKTEGPMRAVDAVYRVIYFNIEILSVAALIGVMLIFLTATLLYYLRPRHGDYAESEQFDSMLATLYLSTLMLTGQGKPSGGTTNLPWYTQIVVWMTSAFTVTMFALPASLLTWGFAAEAQRIALRARRRANKKRRNQNQDGGSSHSSESEDDNSTDEEYWKIIARDINFNEINEQQLRAASTPMPCPSSAAEVPGQRLTHASNDTSREWALVHRRLQALQEQVNADSKQFDRILEYLSSAKQ